MWNDNFSTQYCCLYNLFVNQILQLFMLVSSVWVCSVCVCMGGVNLSIFLWEEDLPTASYLIFCNPRTNSMKMSRKKSFFQIFDWHKSLETFDGKNFWKKTICKWQEGKNSVRFIHIFSSNQSADPFIKLSNYYSQLNFVFNFFRLEGCKWQFSPIYVYYNIL